MLPFWETCETWFGVSQHRQVWGLVPRLEVPNGYPRLGARHWAALGSTWGAGTVADPRSGLELWKNKIAGLPLLYYTGKYCVRSTQDGKQKKTMRNQTCVKLAPAFNPSG